VAELSLGLIFGLGIAGSCCILVHANAADEVEPETKPCQENKTGQKEEAIVNTIPFLVGF
jgi:hypothetical protein